MKLVTARKLKIVEVLLEGKGPTAKGWWSMYCPYHGDHKRSAGLNVEDGRFVCQTCGMRCTIDDLIRDKEDWVIVVPGYQTRSDTKRPVKEITEAMVDGWHSALLSNQDRLAALKERRGLNDKTIAKYELGWDISQAAYTIPVRGLDGEILNIRFYQLDPPNERRKIWSVDGRGTPTLFPVDQLDYVNLVVCEGEMDALLTIQNGIPAITRTGAADVWNPVWSSLFKGKVVYICHDADTKGQSANGKIAKELDGYALRTVIIELPFDVTKKDGLDLTDYWLDDHTREDFVKMAIAASEDTDPPDDDEVQEEIFGVNVMSSFDASLTGKTLRMKVTVVGKRSPSYILPHVIHYECDLKASPELCANCTVSFLGKNGRYHHTIEPDDPIILELVKIKKKELVKAVNDHAGVQKCGRVDVKVEDHRTVEEAYVRASIEDGPSYVDQDFTHRRIISSVSHDLDANQSVILTGTIRPNPNNQENEFQAWGVTKPPTGLDNFAVTPEVLEQMQEFRSIDPMAKLEEIADDLAVHHTKIFHREDLHILTDLVLHSVIELPFTDSTDSKGWLDCLVLGDTRTGKSAIAKAMTELYQAGEIVNCEASTFAGVVGGLDKTADGGWIVKWGSVPVFDRRAVILDEISGLQQQEIGHMSEMRSSGVAKLTKIKTEQAFARTRLLWLGNSRDGKRLNTNTYAVDVLKPLIGNNEDIARFDLAMCVFSDEVPSEEINKFRSNGQASHFTNDGYRGVLQWAWTRKRSDIKWAAGVEQLVLDLATKVGNRYIEDPPLVQGANMRMKIARIAAAIAARTYSTTDGKKLLIQKHHALAAVEFLHRLYGNPGFGYEILSKQVLRDANALQVNMKEVKTFLGTKRNLIGLIKRTPKLNFMQLKTIFGSDEEVRMIMTKMWELKAAKVSAEGMVIEPGVLAELRGMHGE